MNIKSVFDKVYAAVDGLGKVINMICLVCACIAGVGMFVCLIYGFFTRYVIGFQAIWTEEIARFCLIWVTMTGCSVAWRNNQLTRFTILLDKLPRGARMIQEIIVTLFVGIYLTIFCISGNAALVIFKITKASVTKLSLKYVAFGLYLGAAAMVYHCIPKLMMQIHDAVMYFQGKPSVETGEVK